MTRSRMFYVFLASFMALFFCGSALAQYNDSAGSNAPMQYDFEDVEVEVDAVDSSGKAYKKKETRKTRVKRAAKNAKRDTHGNAAGNTYDLAVDGAFEGQTIVVLHFYTGFDFSLPRDAVAEKGFSVYRFLNTAPDPKELASALEKANQLWIVSGSSRQLNDEHIAVIKDFFDAGHGLYIWGDNDPYYADANAVAEAIFEVKMLGDTPGGQVVDVQSEEGKHSGIIANHLLSTGLETVYEGVTIATIQDNGVLTPLIYGSAGNLVAAFYDHDGKRAIFDGGFTRLYVGWETAGTPRYVKNAAAWLANYERFGAAVTATATPAAP